ncbi:MAG: hypothetical protein ACPGKS_04735 [Coraliomargarita sp.]
MMGIIRTMIANLLRSREGCLRLALLVVVAAFSIYFGFVHFTALDSVEFVKHTGYYFMMAALLTFGFEAAFAIRRERHKLLAWLREQLGWPFWLLLIALTLYLWISQPIGFKVVMDEVNLLGTSMYLHLDNKAMSILRGYELNGSFLPLGGFVDKRPLFFPFLVSFLHDATGYRPENAFYMNLALIPLTLTATYVLGVLVSRERQGGLLAMVLVACFPMFNQVSHGGGFETLNYFVILLVALCACFYLQAPSRVSLSLLCLSLVILANVRYESVLFVFPVAVLILIGWFRSREVILSRGLLLTPILLMPVPMLHRVFEIDPKHSWQLNSKEGAVEPFGTEYFARNLDQAITFFFDYTHSLPNSVFVSLFGMVGSIFFVLMLYRSIRESKQLNPACVSVAIVGLGVVGLMLLLLLYFWDFDDVVTRRLALPILFLMIFPGVAAFGAQAQRKLFFNWLLAFAFISLVIEVAPRQAKNMYTNEYIPAQVINWKQEFAQQQEDKNILVIDVPGVWMINKIPAITKNRAINRKELIKFHLENETFDHIYVSEIFTKDFRDGVLRGGKLARLDTSFTLEPVASRTFNGIVFARISEIVDVDVEFPQELAERFEEIDAEGLSRFERLEYQSRTQRKLAALLP